MTNLSEQDKVYFGFSFSKNAQVTLVSIPQQDLEGVPESVLAKLADSKWKSDPKSGTSAEHPLLTRPLDSPVDGIWQEYSRDTLVELIVSAYKGIAGEQLELPLGLELEDALEFLDYYGVEPCSPSRIIVPKDENLAVHLRAKLFLREMGYLPEVKNLIVDSVAKEPRRCSFFVFSHEGDQEDIVNKYNLKEKFTLIRGGSGLRDNNRWIEEPRHQQRLVNDLEDEGLEAEFLKGNLFELNDSMDFTFRSISDSISSHLCRIACRESCLEGKYRGFDFEFNDGRSVLKVSLPQRAKKARVL
eukprot:CAMPEP_0194334794 /NCGR_PEP_ID=MMETSP0171-20130528/67316_1 /TAXON_ID=218684 /ORGANISM="Corethron pennatum, Strain L29A3" /LENGTH=300 /DNA_ID=CAMNT_0039097599 /DNA_START=14 /DNA_END=916 /DNA_ORIENTATION=-